MAVTLLVGACSSGVSDEAAEEVLSRCEPVSQATLDYIETGLTVDNGTLSKAAAVNSDFGPTVWVIGAQFNGDGFDGDRYLAIWAVVDGIEVSEITKMAAADDFTKGISTWGEDFGTDLALIDGVSAAGACVIAKQQG
jgi:hypothetical protein